MAKFNLVYRGHNATLRYRTSGGTYHAKVRVSEASYDYAVNSTESHSRLVRAFYPHRRALGTFKVTVDLIHYSEFHEFMRWLRGYSESVFSSQMGNQKSVNLMEVHMPSRHFHKYGILTSGINDHDNVASMAFREELTFVTVYDVHDPGTHLVSTNSISEFKPPKVDPESVLAFYPETVSSYHDKDRSIYNAPPGPTFPHIHPPGGGTQVT